MLDTIGLPLSMKKYKPKRISNVKRFELNKRESASERGYDWKWYNYRKKFLEANPKCYCCGQKAKVVDHYVAWKVDKEKYFWNERNYIPLCEYHHNYITGKFDRFKIPLMREKSNYINKERDKNNITIKVKIVPIPTSTQNKG